MPAGVVDSRRGRSRRRDEGGVVAKGGAVVESGEDGDGGDVPDRGDEESPRDKSDEKTTGHIVCVSMTGVARTSEAYVAACFVSSGAARGLPKMRA